MTTDVQPVGFWYGESVLANLVAAVCAGEVPARGLIAAGAPALDVDVPDQVDLTSPLHEHPYTQVSIHQWHSEWCERLKEPPRR